MYSSYLASAVDLLSYGLTYPWLYSLSSALCCFLTTTDERSRIFRKIFLHYLLLGPFFCSLVVALLPFYLTGQILWTILCHTAEKRDCSIVNVDDDRDSRDKAALRDKDTYTFATANLLLGLDLLGKFQNMPCSYARLGRIGSSFRDGFDGGELRNLARLDEGSEGKDSSVRCSWPDVDFLLLQEVWDRPSYRSLMECLRGRFKHFIVDVSRQSWGNNYCTGSSGLMLASRYPIMAADYFPFDNKKSNWQALISYGMIMAKTDLDLGLELSANKKRRVGFVAILHAMAYQEKEDLIGEALSSAQRAFNKFRSENTSHENEEVRFATIGGDFNFDNISPGDSSNHNHPIFHQYSDICMEKPGKDKQWAIGTELRQLKIYDEVHESPEKFKAVLQDDVKRRFYVIDADVLEQTMDLMYCDPKPAGDGKILATPDGGMRRIDRILFDTSCPTKPTGAAFLTALAGLTDHIPYSVTVSSKE